MSELLEEVGLDGYIIVSLVALGWMATLGCLATARWRLPRASLLLAGVVLGLGVTTLLVGVRAEANRLRQGERGVVHASPDYRMQLLVGELDGASAVRMLGVVAGLPFALLGATVLVAGLRRAGSAP
jgi:hypothetical protein